MKTALTTLAILFFITFLSYTIIGTDSNIPELKRRVPLEVAERNWKILRYEGFQYGSWCHHGGSVWYHVCNIDNPNIQYRVKISLWNGELRYYYGEPEILQRLEINTLK